MKFATEIEVSFGDCDPAGIVFYPNVFRWMDGTFHKMLRPLGGHEKICGELDALGLGLVDASTQFTGTIRDCDLLEIGGSIAEWSKRSVTLKYTGLVAGRPVFEGKEVRCLFKRSDDGIVAGDISAFRDILENKHV